MSLFTLIFRGCKTGEGHFQFLTQQGREILECVKLQTQKLASIRHLPHDRPRRPSLDSVPCTRSSENETVDSLTSNSFSWWSNTDTCYKIRDKKMPVKEGRVSQLSSSGTQHQTEASFVVGSEGDLALLQCFSVFLPSCTASSALHLPSDSFQLPHKLLLLQERTLRFYLKNPKVPDWLLLARANLETFNSQSQTLHGSL